MADIKTRDAVKGTIKTIGDAVGNIQTYQL